MWPKSSDPHVFDYNDVIPPPPHSKHLSEYRLIDFLLENGVPCDIVNKYHHSGTPAGYTVKCAFPIVRIVRLWVDGGWGYGDLTFKEFVEKICITQETSK